MQMDVWGQCGTFKYKEIIYCNFIYNWADAMGQRSHKNIGEIQINCQRKAKD